MLKGCLAQLRPRAKVVVMDARGSKRAVRLARTLLASGHLTGPHRAGAQPLFDFDEFK